MGEQGGGPRGRATPAVRPPVAAAMVVVAVVGFTITGFELASGISGPRSALLALVGFAAAAMLSVIPISLAVSRRSALEAEYGDLVQNADAVVWWLADGADAYGPISAGASRILGHAHDELLRVSRWFELVHAEDRAELATCRDATLSTMVGREVDYRMLGADGVTVKSTASLGIAVYPDDAEDADLLTQRADVAMYAAKRSGGGWRAYSPADDQSSIERLTLLADLHHELTRARSETLGLHYQPVLSLAAGGITGVEALLRWDHHAFGTLDPETVVGLAEVSGLADDLARHVTRLAVAASRTWRNQGVELCMAVNLSARNLHDAHLSDWISSVLREHAVPASSLKCELTESQLMDDPALSLQVLGRLRDIGVRTAIDDFGTGYSSLSYLRRLPVDEIKIDRSFVMQMADDHNDHLIVRTVIDLPHNLGLRVLAEGVEDERTLSLLRSLGCDEAQGHLIGRPMTAERLLAGLQPSVPLHGV